MPRRAPAARSRRPLVAHAVVALVAALVVACGNQAVTPTAIPPPSGSARSTPSSSPRPSAKADPGTAALNAFVALVTKDGFSYEATFSGQSRHTTDILPIRNGLLQVSGNDVLVRATFLFPSSHRYVVEHRYVGGKAWIRFATTDAWRRLTFRPADSMAAFAAIRSISDVAYLGPIASNGKTFYRASFRSAIVNPVMIPAGNLTDEALTSPRLIVLLDVAGRPVTGTATIEGHGRVSGQLQEIVIDLTITFTKLGQAVSIKSP